MSKRVDVATLARVVEGWQHVAEARAANYQSDYENDSRVSADHCLALAKRERATAGMCRQIVEVLNAQANDVAALTAQLAEAQRQLYAERRFRVMDAANAIDEANLLRAQLTAAQAEATALREALERTRTYIRQAMRPISVKEACCETAYDRAQRRGLEHALRALDVEFAKVDSTRGGQPPTGGRA